jgi:hypothetical protein
MPILKYMGWVGASLVAFLLYADWYFPRPVREPYGDMINSPVIRITSVQPPLERVFIDTSVPTIVPPPVLFEDTAPRTSPPLQSHASPGALALIERETLLRITKDTIERPASSRIEVSESRSTLTEADRLNIPHLQHEASAQRIPSVKRGAPPNVATIISASNGVVRHTRAAARQTADVEKSKLQPQHQKKKAAKTDRSKAVVEIRSCPPNAFAGLLKALNISRECET